MTDSLPIDLHFPVLHQYWMDTGLLGFYLLAKDAQMLHPEIEFLANETGIHLKGSGTDLEIFLRKVYKVLLRDYYNTSTPKQKEDLAGFYYDTEKDEFVRFPKVKSRGIAEVIFSKAPRPTQEIVTYLKNGKNQLPEPYTGLQERLDAFLSENKAQSRWGNISHKWEKCASTNSRYFPSSQEIQSDMLYMLYVWQENSFSQGNLRDSFSADCKFYGNQVLCVRM